MSKDKRLTIKEVVQKTGYKQSTITRWCRTGKLPNAEKIISPANEYWLIPESDLKNIGEVKRGRPKKES
jgi:predicted site-specific integrase-resolvase